MADWKAFKDDCKRLLTEDNITDEATTSCNHVIGAILQAAEKYVPVFSRPSIQQEDASILIGRAHSGGQRTKQGEEQDAADT